MTKAETQRRRTPHCRTTVVTFRVTFNNLSRPKEENVSVSPRLWQDVAQPLSNMSPVVSHGLALKSLESAVGSLCSHYRMERLKTHWMGNADGRFPHRTLWSKISEIILQKRDFFFLFLLLHETFPQTVHVKDSSRSWEPNGMAFLVVCTHSLFWVASWLFFIRRLILTKLREMFNP